MCCLKPNWKPTLIFRKQCENLTNSWFQLILDFDGFHVGKYTKHGFTWPYGYPKPWHVLSTFRPKKTLENEGADRTQKISVATPTNECCGFQSNFVPIWLLESYYITPKSSKINHPSIGSSWRCDLSRTRKNASRAVKTYKNPKFAWSLVF